MEGILAIIFLGFIVYYFIKRNKQKNLLKATTYKTHKTDNFMSDQKQTPTKKKFKKIAWISALSLFAIFAIIGMNIDPELAKEKREQKAKERAISQVAEKESSPQISKPSPQKTDKPQTAKHIDVKIISERDTSFAGRKRNQVDVYAPDAITKDEREKVLTQLAESYEKQGYQYIQIFLRPVTDKDYTSQFGSFGSVVYSPDGCGVSGKDCGGEKWILKASDYVLTKEDQKYIDLYMKHHRAILLDFNKDPDNWSIEKSDKLEEQFNKALAKDLGVDPDNIPMFMIF